MFPSQLRKENHHWVQFAWKYKRRTCQDHRLADWGTNATTRRLKRGLAADSLDESRVSSDPFKQFTRWLRDLASRRAPLLRTMTLATATRSGRPSARTLLLRTFDDSGFVFYTNYNGRKGKELAENPQAALVFLLAAARPGKFG